MSNTLKALIVGIIGLLAVGCASTPTMKNVAGTYEGKLGNGVPVKAVFLKDGMYEQYTNGEKDESEYTWKIVGGEIHGVDSEGVIAVIRVNKDGSLTPIALIDGDGKREEAPKDFQLTLKKIK